MQATTTPLGSALEEAAERYVGLSLRTLDPLSFEGVRSLLRLGGSLDVEKCLMLADLRALEGRLRSAEGDARATVRSYSMALRLYLEAVDERGSSVLGEHRALADDTAERLQVFDLDPETASLSFRYRSYSEEA